MNNYQRLKDIREDRDLTQQNIAELLETTRQQVGKWENGIQLMGIDKYIKLAKFFNISIDYLSGIIDETRPLYETNKKRNENLLILSNEEIKILTALRDNANFKNAVLANLKLIAEPSDSKRETKKSV